MIRETPIDARRRRFDNERPMPGLLIDKKVLIVDNEPDIRLAVDVAMQSEGALTQTVGDGDTATAVCLSDPPDLVILDMMLPGRSGFLVLEAVKGRPNPPVVIMITGNEGKRHREYAEARGVDAYFQKPLSLENLITTAADLLARRPALP